MSATGMKKAGILQTVILLVVVASVNAAGIMDTARSITEHPRSQDYPAEDFEVVELFRAEITSDLETAVAGGYPMPWLDEVLNDETIPEEDRYWLDCRIRAAIAIEFHTFYTKNGSPVTYEAEWIMPGENYWRESFTVNMPDCEYGTLPFNTRSDWRVDPGITVNNYGERIGEFVHCGVASRLNTSRDGTIAAGAFPTGNGFQPVLLYSDATYFISPITMNYGMCGISNSGNFIIVSSAGRTDRQTGEEVPPQAILLNEHGEILWETELEMTPVGNPGPVISPDDRYCAVVTQAEDIRNVGIRGMIQVFSLNTGNEIWRIENPGGSTARFSPDGKTLFLPGIIGEASAYNMDDGAQIWTDQRISKDELTYTNLRILNGSNNADFLTAIVVPEQRTADYFVTLFSNTGRILEMDHVNGQMDISPNGIFTITENYIPYSIPRMMAPFIVRRIERGE